MGAQIVFNYALWAQAFPEFSNIPEIKVTQVYLPAATGYWRNDGTAPTNNPQQQQTIIWFLVAHLCMIFDGTNTSPASGLVGRISSASEGSVSVSAEMAAATSSSAWFMQTTYGAAFWQLTAAYRTARYVPGRPRRFGVFPFG